MTSWNPALDHLTGVHDVDAVRDVAAEMSCDVGVPALFITQLLQQIQPSSRIETSSMEIGSSPSITWGSDARHGRSRCAAAARPRAHAVLVDVLLRRREVDALQQLDDLLLDRRTWHGHGFSALPRMWRIDFSEFSEAANVLEKQLNLA